jgi:hypothetical protein
MNCAPDNHFFETVSKGNSLVAQFYQPDLSENIDSPFTQDGNNKLVRRSYWLDMNDRTLVVVYDTEHLPNLLKVPGVQSVARMEGEPFAISIGGEEKRVPHDGPRHSALYEIDGPHVLVSREWAKAVEAGRWSRDVRPFTHNRRHALYRLR